MILSASGWPNVTFVTDHMDKTRALGPRNTMADSVLGTLAAGSRYRLAFWPRLGRAESVGRQLYYGGRG